MDMKHMEHLSSVAMSDIEHLRRKEASYQGSWKKRGGVGAFMMLARKWDRLEGMLTAPGRTPYDVFEAIEMQPEGQDGSELAEIRDLRRYLLLVEAEMVARGAVSSGKRTLQITPAKNEKKPRQMTKIPERLVDGDLDIPESELPKYLIPTGGNRLLVNRCALKKEEWDHLPRLFCELNNKEYQEIPEEYQPLYSWHDNENKWRLKKEYVEHWGRET